MAVTGRSFICDSGPTHGVTKSTDPADRCGVYTSLAAVPDAHRLQRYRDRYANRNVWQSFLTEHLLVEHDSERFARAARRAGDHWLAHCRARERHHALARPADVESWCQALLAERAVSTAYNQYWVRIERFYTWLQRTRAHPHQYHPVRMAAVDGAAASRIWAEKMARGRDGGSA